MRVWWRGKETDWRIGDLREEVEVVWRVVEERRVGRGPGRELFVCEQRNTTARPSEKGGEGGKRKYGPPAQPRRGGERRGGDTSVTSQKMGLGLLDDSKSIGTLLAPSRIFRASCLGLAPKVPNTF